MATMTNARRLSASLLAPVLEEVRWLERELPEPKDQREYAQERCIVAITEALGEAMERAGITRADLARKLGVTKSHVTQLFAGRNLTLRTIGDVLWACGLEVTDLQVEPLGVVVVPSEHAAEWRMAESPYADASAKASIEVTLQPPDEYSPRCSAFPEASIAQKLSYDASSELDALLCMHANPDLALAA